MYLESPPSGAAIMTLCRSCKRSIALTKRDVKTKHVVLINTLNAQSCPMCAVSFRQVERGLRELAKMMELTIEVIPQQ